MGDEPTSTGERKILPPPYCPLCGKREADEEGNCVKHGIKLRKAFPGTAVGFGALGAGLAIFGGAPLRGVALLSMTAAAIGLGIDIVGHLTWAPSKLRRVIRRGMAGVVYGALAGYVIAYLAAGGIAAVIHRDPAFLSFLFIIGGAFMGALYLFVVSIATNE